MNLRAVLERKYGPLTGVQWLLIVAAGAAVAYLIFRRRGEPAAEAEVTEEAGGGRSGAGELPNLPTGPILVPSEGEGEGGGDGGGGFLDIGPITVDPIMVDPIMVEPIAFEGPLEVDINLPQGGGGNGGGVVRHTHAHAGKHHGKRHDKRHTHKHVHRKGRANVRRPAGSAATGRGVRAPAPPRPSLTAQPVAKGVGPANSVRVSQEIGRRGVSIAPTNPRNPGQPQRLARPSGRK